jgi:PRTRC genetic system protein C
MALTVESLTRKFTYNGVDLPDPNPSLTVDQCREIFAQAHPEIANAAIEGPVTKGGVQSYTFVRSVGTKG